jgi:cytochrome c oxidase cbb3-type subunit III
MMITKKAVAMKKFKSILFLLGGLFMAFPGMAQEATWTSRLQAMDSSELTLYIILAVVLGVILLLLILMIYLMNFMAGVFRKEMKTQEATPSWWVDFKKKFITGNLRPVGSKEEKDLMMDHSYDGIVELDNHMPPWLANVFFITIGFAVIYFTYYTVLGLGTTQLQEYENEQRLAAVQIDAFKATQVSNIDENSVVYDGSASALTAGKNIFAANCVACHAQDGGGGVGPNLTDDYWIHGNSIKEIFSVTKYGVPAKGMIPWADQLSPEEMQQVSSYIISLKGTVPANPKEPQGELITPETDAPANEEGATDVVAEAKPIG